MHLREAATADLDAVTLYRVLALRSEVFVVEQACPYLDLDGRDLEPRARQLWIEHDDGTVLATLRVLGEPDGSVRVGRVASSAAARGTGLAAQLVRRALEFADGRPVVLDAQSYLRGWYERLGFVVTGEEFLEDGIPHVPMVRR